MEYWLLDNDAGWVGFMGSCHYWLVLVYVLVVRPFPAFNLAADKRTALMGFGLSPMFQRLSRMFQRIRINP
jgi:polysaccharide pyruvyl transferase WcaK-like protein